MHVGGYTHTSHNNLQLLQYWTDNSSKILPKVDMKMPEQEQDQQEEEMEASMNYLQRRKPRKFLLDFSYLDVIWAKDTKIIIRAGEHPPIIIDSPSRMVSEGQFEKG